MSSSPDAQLKHYLKVFVFTAIFLFQVVPVYADWTSDLIDSLEDEVEQGAVDVNGEGDPLFAPSKLLPLADGNKWVYEYRESNTLDAATIVNAALGDLLEEGDGVCIKPLVFDDAQLTLYLINYNTHIVLYGLELDIPGNPLPQKKFMFKNGETLTPSSGVVIAAMTGTDLSEIASRSGSSITDGEVVSWEVTDRSSAFVEHPRPKTYIGTVDNTAFNVQIEKGRSSEFSIYSSGNFIGKIGFVFAPAVGLSLISFTTGDPISYVYKLRENLTTAVELASAENVGHFECANVSESSVSRADSGLITYWFMLSWVFVVLLRAFYRFEIRH